MSNNMDWIDAEEKKRGESSGDYFKIKEGDNRIQLLTHAAPYPQVWDGVRYRPAEEGDKNVSVKGVCWVLQDGEIKLATLAYSVIKQIRALMQDEDWAFEEFPMPRQINIKAVNAGTKEVEYTVVPSPKETPVSQETLDAIEKKPTPEDMVEKFRAKVAPKQPAEEIPYPEVNPDEIPF